MDKKNDIKKDELKQVQDDEKVKLGWKDVLAIIIAQFEILMPIALIAIVVLALLLLFIDKVWLKN